jgi:hypothetical protein
MNLKQVTYPYALFFDIAEDQIQALTMLFDTQPIAKAGLL